MSARGDGMRRSSVTSTVPSEQLAGLSLPELRAYRQKLAAEEDKVSYWRRLTHARIDVLQAASGTDLPLSFEGLVSALGDTGTGRSRRALVRVHATEPLPDLPELSDMWTTEIDQHDAEQVEAAITELRNAERQLTDYRRALHERIDEATRELILRYRENPAAALDALPESIR